MNARVGASSACAGERKPVATAVDNDPAASRDAAALALAPTALARRSTPAEVLEGAGFGCFANGGRNDRIRCSLGYVTLVLF
jgi:hypothetical protein